jgi:hypothetical protein
MEVDQSAVQQQLAAGEELAVANDTQGTLFLVQQIVLEGASVYLLCQGLAQR